MRIKKLVLFSFILVVTIGMIFSAGITVNSPAGGNIWYKGSIHNIAWTLSGCSSSSPNVKINIFKNSVTQANFIEQLTATTNSGSKSWTIPNTYVNGSYIIRIKTNDNGCFGDSGIFTISDKPVTPTISVKSPNLSDKWEKGKTYAIIWKSVGQMDPNVKINIFKNSINSVNFIEQIICPNNGSKNWTIPNKYVSGNYILRIKTAGGKVVFGDSDIFQIKDGISGVIIKPASLSVDVPSLNAAWEKGKYHMIKWTGLGDLAKFVRITLNDKTGNSIIQNINMNAPNNGSFNWLIPASVPDGQYTIKIKTTDNKLSDMSDIFKVTSPAQNNSNNKFAIIKGFTTLQTPTTILKNNQNFFLTSQKVRFYSPKSGYIWKPLNDYDVTFEVTKSANPKNLHLYLNVILVPADSSKSIGLFYLKEQLDKYAKETKSGFIYSFKWKFLGSYNLQSGKYKIVVKSNFYDLKGESEVFSIKNDISNNTAFLGEDQPDLKIEDVYFDFFLWMIRARIRNQGFSQYKGDLQFKYTFNNKSQHTLSDKNCKNDLISGGKNFKNVTIGKYQVKVFDLMTYRCFEKRPGDYLPKRGPMNYYLTLYNKSNQISKKTGLVCKTKKSDIIAASAIHLYNNTGRFNYVTDKSTISPGNFNWFRNTFKAKIGVEVWNWGCSSRTFNINLHMDGPYLNGKNGITIGTITLQPGEQRYFSSNPITFSIPQDSKYRRILLVADQPEKSNEGYPNSYMNNFILGNIRIYNEDNTIRGVVNW